MKASSVGKKFFDSSAISLFSVTALGLWIFSLFIIALYVVASLTGNFEAWNVQMPHGYEAGNALGNVTLGFHLVFAAIISVIGPLQLIPKIRSRVPVLHRWLGRIYVIAAIILSLSGFYLIGSGRKLVGDFSQHFAIFINGILILSCTCCALYYALKRKFAIHQRWALRMFWAVNGVWMFRIGLMFWLVLNGKPVGFDIESFSGPFLTVLAIAVYVLPVIFVEIYLRAKDSKNNAAHYLVGIANYILAIIMIIGIFGATMGLWLPIVISRF